MKIIIFNPESSWDLDTRVSSGHRMSEQPPPDANPVAGNWTHWQKRRKIWWEEAAWKSSPFAVTAQCVNTDRCQVPSTQLWQKAWNELPGNPQNSGHCHSDCPERGHTNGLLSSKHWILHLRNTPAIFLGEIHTVANSYRRHPWSPVMVSEPTVPTQVPIRQRFNGWVGLQNALCKRHGIQELKGVLKGLPTQEC